MIKAMHLKLGSLYGVADPLAADGRFLGPRTKVDLESIDRRVARMKAAGLETLLLQLDEGFAFGANREANLPGAVSHLALARHVEKWRAEGVEVVPLVNLSAARCEWMGFLSRQISTPEYYDFVRSVLREASAVCRRPKYIHLGMDYETKKGTAHRAFTMLRAKRLLWHDLQFYSDVVEGLGARAWMWADVADDRMEEFCERAPRTVVWSHRYIGQHTPDSPKFTEESRRSLEVFKTLDEGGFRQIPCCTTANPVVHPGRSGLETTQNPGVVAAYARANLRPERFLGLVCYSFYSHEAEGDSQFSRVCDICRTAFA